MNGGGREAAMRALRRWAERVDHELDAFRDASEHLGNCDRIPRVTWAPHQVQWYQRWDGPYRWVLCATFEDRVDMVSAFFWTQPDWAGRETKVIYTNEPVAFAMELWEFLKPTVEDPPAVDYA